MSHPSASAVFGEMVWLYSRSEIHKNWPINSVHQWLTPALKARQYRIYHKRGKPIGFVTWARLSAKVEEAYVRNPGSLTPDNWKSGERIWLIDFVAPFGDAKQISRDLRNTVFPDDVGRFLRAKPGSNLLQIHYAHGHRALSAARDRVRSPSVQITN
ncbi:toxin-activating lysine-acyltransferase [Pontivivens insulae]|uniref:toxin-activating lysine-acyltransferase n=1 Tax=Pontivivens insulae TaxID=1639689 RepID=UPI000D55DF7D|nr:toxin-activating lysine-acyltransferase [Pontivivens insulae]RED13904.1 cytolysin-activating lysine-acyltransferase [Pontivivens insulae]